MKSEKPTVVCKQLDFPLDPELVYSGEQVIDLLEKANANKWLLKPSRFYASRILGEAVIERRGAVQ